MNNVQSGPHTFQPLRWWDRCKNGRCHHCLLPHYMHSDGKLNYWVPARAIGDKRPAYKRSELRETQ